MTDDRKNDPRLQRTIIGPLPAAPRGNDKAPRRPNRGDRDQERRAPQDPQPPLRMGLSPLVEAAADLIELATYVRGNGEIRDVDGFRRKVFAEVRNFEREAKRKGYSAEDIDDAAFAIAATIDDAALGAAWGTQARWSEQTLVTKLFGRAFAGEEFFGRLKRIKAQRSRSDALELYFLCLSIGFEGMYRTQGEAEHPELKRVRNETWEDVIDQHGEEQVLSRRWKGIDTSRKPLREVIPAWFVMVLAIGAVLASFAIAWGYPYAAVASRIDERVDVKRPQVASAPEEKVDAERLTACFLDDAQQRRLVEVKGLEDGSVLIRLTAVDVFPSGRADMDGVDGPLAQKALKSIAEAIREQGGRVEVVGHTDDVPIRRGWRDNQQLSEARASVVADMLRNSGVPEPDIKGEGESDPVASNDTEEGRAQNRRVEIFFTAYGTFDLARCKTQGGA